jgi:hypothetical protein
MAAELDLKAVSVFSTVSEAALSSLLSAPTPETVTSFLQNVQRNAKECEQNKSHRVRLEVELETVVRTNESKVKVLQNSRDKALSDVQKIRGDLQQSGMCLHSCILPAANMSSRDESVTGPVGTRTPSKYHFIRCLGDHHSQVPHKLTRSVESRHACSP